MHKYMYDPRNTHTNKAIIKNPKNPTHSLSLPLLVNGQIGEHLDLISVLYFVLHPRLR